MRQGAGVETSGRIIDTGARYPLTSQDFFGHRGRRPAPMTKYVYFFGGGRAEGSSVMRNLLGGKGCELAEMTNLGIPVPPGFTVTTQAWAHYNRSGHEWPEELWDQTLENLQRLEGAADAGFGDPKRPLLVSVRSGARVSMPGMMETILNLGLNDATVEGLAARTRNERFAWDCYRRFVMMFGDVVLGVRREVFDAELDAAKSRLGVKSDPEVPAAELRKLTDVFKSIISERTGRPFPEDVKDQLRLAINAVFDSWLPKQASEFTVQEGKLYLLQTRTGKRSARAAVKVARDLVNEHVIDQHTALLRVRPQEVNEAIRPVFDDRDKAAAIDKGRLLARGLPAAPGAAVGKAVFDADRAVEWAHANEKVILVRPETSPEDVAGMYAAEGIVTSRGGRTSHAAVVAVGMGKACVVGAAEILVDEQRRVFEVGGRIVREGDWISVDGGTGEVLLDSVKTVEGQLGDEVRELLAWADRYRTEGLGVRANADTPADAQRAREFGAEGIGLVRTEHMFFAPDRIPIVREMIMALDQATRRTALEKLRPFQRDDFMGIFRAMDGLPVTIRLLDPPLQEFLPNHKEYTELIETRSRLQALGINPEEQARLEAIIASVEKLREANPMLGHRGCRLGITHPEIYGMQVRAIMEAACMVAEQGVHVEPEIMIPLTGTVGEMKETFEQTKRVADGVIAETGIAVRYLIGTMIEVPRAALIAAQIAEFAEFFSFGTNDLTQLTYGHSRDDVAKFLPKYLDMGLVPHDPFSVLDQEGVGEMITIGIERGRSRRPNLKIGICGEHGGEASSVEFCYRVKMTYVSCSPYLIPGARLAAAQARIKERQVGGSGDYRV